MEDNKLTIEDLATQEDLPTSTIRLYVQESLLPRPVRQGRRAYYSDHHVERLRSIRRLMDRGFSLAAIKQMFDLNDSGGDLNTLLHSHSEPVELSSSEFASLFPTGQIDPGVVKEGVALGVLMVSEDGIRFSDAQHLKNALALAEIGVSAQAGLAVWKRTRSRVALIAQDYVDLASSLRDSVDEHLMKRLLTLGLESLKLAYLAEMESLELTSIHRR